MITGPDFIWLHFPKCGGSATEAALAVIFGGRDDVRFDPLDPANVIWHHSIEQRRAYDPAFSVGDRKIICGIRRLPHWLLSRVHFEAQRGPGFRVATREMLLRGQFYRRDGEIVQADDRAKRYSNPRVDHWLRLESLASDLAAALGLPESVVSGALSEKNRTRANYIKEIGFWFTARELAALYEANPVWARIEKDVYGSLLIER